MFKFNLIYFVLALALLAIEVAIAAFLHDAYIRPFGGDFLVVILIYCIVKSAATIPVNNALAGVLLFAYLVEISQYFHLIKLLGLQSSLAARLILGTSFAWTDMLMYTLGVLAVWLLEKAFNRI